MPFLLYGFPIRELIRHWRYNHLEGELNFDGKWSLVYSLQSFPLPRSHLKWDLCVSPSSSSCCVGLCNSNQGKGSRYPIWGWGLGGELVGVGRESGDEPPLQNKSSLDGRLDSRTKLVFARQMIMNFSLFITYQVCENVPDIECANIISAP